MPICAQEWRVRTGLTNCNVLKVIYFGALRSYHPSGVTVPPPTWKGWKALLLMLAMPLLYNVTTIITILGIALWFGHTRMGSCNGNCDIKIRPICGS